MSFLGADIPFSTVLPVDGSFFMGSQAVTAASGQPAFAFTVGANPEVPNGGVLAWLVANGISNAPTVTGATAVSASWNNTAGTIHLFSLWVNEALSVFYSTVPCVPGFLLTPTAFTTAAAGQTITIAYGGGNAYVGSGGSAGLAPITPSLAAFSMSVSRPSDSPAYTPSVPALASVSTVTAGATSVTLNVSSAWQAGDVVVLSYSPTGAGVSLPIVAGSIAILQDQQTAPPNVLAPWTATFTVP